MDKVTPRLPFAKFSTKQSSQSPESSQSSLRERFTGIHARDRPFVRRVLLHFGVPSRDVDDLVQEVFVICWKRLEGLKVDVDPRPWLYTVAFYRAGNYRQLCRNTRERFLGDESDVGTTEFDPGCDPGWMIDAHRSFKRLMRRLSKKLRDVFVAVVLQGLSIKEVAASLRIPLKTAQARMVLAREVVLRTCPFVTA